MARNRELLCARRDKPILVDTVDEMVWHINGAPRGDIIRYCEFFNNFVTLRVFNNLTQTRGD